MPSPPRSSPSLLPESRRSCDRRPDRRSWPQAASMSSPRVRRTVAMTPSLSRRSRNALDHGVGRAAVARARERVERDQVHLGRPAAQQRRELACVLRSVVDAVEHDVLEGDAAGVLPLDVMPAGGEQLGDRVPAVDRHELAAQRIVRRVQRHGERDVGLLGDAQHLRHEAGRADRDAPPREVESDGRPSSARRPARRCDSWRAARPCP